ncbi:MAG: polyol transport system permease protein, partial [Arthrobacter pascens]|nr:polyol transport system permease protein [Arthrobacter pascens]
MTTTLTPRPTSVPPARSAVRAREQRRRFNGSLLTALTWVIGFAFFAPVLWLVMTAFKQEADAASNPPRFFFEPTLDQFRHVLESGAGSYFGNSLIATGVSTLLVI